jgi:hypothetical protein
MLNLPTLLRDSAVCAALLVLCAPLSGPLFGLPGVGSGTMLALAVGAMTSLLNMQTLGWVVSALEPGVHPREFSRRLLVQQGGALAAIVGLLVARVPPVAFVIGFLCFFPPVALRAFLGLRARPVQEPA